MLAKLFNLIILYGYVPDSCGLSYTVPLLKEKNSYKSFKTDDFRGISISCVISKVFEHCVFDRFSAFLDSHQRISLASRKLLVVHMPFILRALL